MNRPFLLCALLVLGGAILGPRALWADTATAGTAKAASRITKGAIRKRTSPLESR